MRDLLTYLIMKAMIIKGYFDIWRMHSNTKNARKKNEKLLFKILNINKNSKIGVKYGYSNIRSVEDYRKAVPTSTFDDYEDYILEMVDENKTNILTSLDVIGYAQSSGSVGSRKIVPLTRPEVNVYTRYTVTRMLAEADSYYRNVLGKKLKMGRGYNTIPAFSDSLPNGLPNSNIPDIAAKELGFLYPFILITPFTKQFDMFEIDSKYINMRLGLADRNMMYLFCVFLMNYTDHMRYLEENWKVIVDDIEKGTISDLAKAIPETKERLLKYFKPNPDRAKELRAEFEKGFDETIMKRIWPNMSVISGIGTASFVPFTNIARRYTKDIPFDFSIYGASEGLFAACDRLESDKQLLLTDSCYYEFIPVENENVILSLDELEIGKEYEIIITNQAGLYRYRCGDVVKVLDYLNDCPYIVFSYRKGQLLSIAGEKTTEAHIAALVKAIEKEADVKIKDWVVYNDLDDYPYHYVLLLENEEGKDLTIYNEFAHKTLEEINVRYKIIQEIGKIVIRNLKAGSQEEWKTKRISEGTPITQYKPVRILDNKEKEDFFMSRIID